MRRWTAPSSARPGDRTAIRLLHYTDRGWRKVGRIDLDGDIDTVVDGINGTTIGRPYSSGDYSVADDGTIAYTLGTEKTPGRRRGSSRAAATPGA